MKIRQIFIPLLILIALAVAAYTLASFFKEEVCGVRGGFWSSSSKSCITSSCYKGKSCEVRENPADYCGKIKISHSPRDVAKWLGEPSNVPSEEFYNRSLNLDGLFTWKNKNSDAVESITFYKGKVAGINCSN